jgi:energy-coupling factor transporter transmembrane protein EcfT
MDSRFKLPALILLSLAVLLGGTYSLVLLTVPIVVCLALVRTPFVSLLRDLRIILVLVLFVVASRALSNAPPLLFSYRWLEVSLTGLLGGVLFGWRLILVTLLGSLFITTTPLSRLQAALAWSLGKVPLIKGARLATMIGLTLGFIPRLFLESRGIADAGKARFAGGGVNWLSWPFVLALAVIRRAFLRAEEITMAMEARCYSEGTVQLHLKSERADWIRLGIVLVVCAISYLAGRL